MDNDRERLLDEFSEIERRLALNAAEREHLEARARELRERLNDPALTRESLN